jgi:hypothetical protein
LFQLLKFEDGVFNLENETEGEKLEWAQKRTQVTNLAAAQEPFQLG